MTNADLPAMPTSIDAQTLSCVGRMDNMEDYYRQQAGITKREMFAMAAMQGILSNNAMIDNCDKQSIEWAAARAASCADALLAELERTK
jgi:4-hydroxyphenylpyruvate dioxygenase-like putative hemolysin